MVEWTFSIPIIKNIFQYYKKHIDLKEREKSMIVEEKRLNVWEQELIRLKKIKEENSGNYVSMIDFNFFNINDIYIQAGDNVPSPHLEFSFYISNRSLFDLKVNKIYMVFYLEDFGELGEINTSDVLDLPHQQILIDRLKLQLHSNAINILKSLKKDGKKNLLRLKLTKMKIDFGGDREFSKPDPYGFNLEIPMDKVYVSL